MDSTFDPVQEPSPPTFTDSPQFLPFSAANSPSGLPLEQPSQHPLGFFPRASSPRSRTHSVASSVSSFISSSRSSYVGETSPDTTGEGFRATLEVSTATLAPDGCGNGFVVDDRVNGQVAVNWDQLVQLLVNPQTTAGLHPDHPIARASALLAGLPVSMQPYPPQFDASTGQVNSMSDTFGGFSFDPTSSAQFAQGGGAGLPSYTNDDYDTPATAHPLRRSFAPYDLAHYVIPTEPLPPLPPRSIDPRQFSEPYSSLPSLQESSHPFHAAHADEEPTLPTPPARFEPRPPSIRRSDSDYTPPVSRREGARQAAAPYPPRPSSSFYQQPHLSTSSLQDFAGASANPSSSASFRSLHDDNASTHSSDSKKKRPLRALNRESERYAWNRHKGQLFQVPAGVDEREGFDEVKFVDGEKRMVPMEILTFPPGSYYKVVEDDLEILPSDNNTRVNTWLRSQACVMACHFRFEGKRPSVIRQHVVSCKARARQLVGYDPLRRLCELQLACQSSIVKLRSRPTSQRLEPHARPATTSSWADVPPARSTCGTDSDLGDDRSIHSFESVGSGSRLSARRGRRPPSFVGSIASISSQSEINEAKPSVENSQPWWTTRPTSMAFAGSPSSWNDAAPPAGESENAVEAMIASSAASVSGESIYSAEEQPSGVASGSQEADWLSNYGLKTPTVNTAFHHQQQMVLDDLPAPSAQSAAMMRRASFLAMDD